jgi:hypothetical protein
MWFPRSLWSKKFIYTCVRFCVSCATVNCILCMLAMSAYVDFSSNWAEMLSNARRSITRGWSITLEGTLHRTGYDAWASILQCIPCTLEIMGETLTEIWSLTWDSERERCEMHISWVRATIKETDCRNLASGKYAFKELYSWKFRTHFVKYNRCCFSHEFKVMNLF